jgi:hypothetical protein
MINNCNNLPPMGGTLAGIAVPHTKDSLS